MDLKAVLIIGGLCLAFGLLLYLPANFWVKRRLRREPADSGLKMRVTGVGLIVYGSTVATLMTLLWLPTLMPYSSLVHFISSPGGRIVSIFSLLLLSTLVERNLKARGIDCVVREHGAPPTHSQPPTKTPGAEPQFPIGTSKQQRSGYRRIASIREVPILVHWSFPFAGLAVAGYCGASPPQVAWYCLAFCLLITLHEAGHFAAARSFGLKVYAVELSGAGGLCRHERTRQVLHSAVIYSAGLLAQTLLLLITGLYLAVMGSPSGAAGEAFATTFTIVNLCIIVINLIPQITFRGLATDGLLLWRLYLHVRKGAPHPSEFTNRTRVDHGQILAPDARLLKLPGFAPQDFVYDIEILNDRTTPMEFVVQVLTRYLHLSREDAVAMMLAIHNKGGVLHPTQSAEVAESLAAAITSDALKLGLSFTCRAVSAQSSDNCVAG